MHKEKELLCNFELFRKFPEEGKQNHRKIKLQRTRQNETQYVVRKKQVNILKEEEPYKKKSFTNQKIL